MYKKPNATIRMILNLKNTQKMNHQAFAQLIYDTIHERADEILMEKKWSDSAHSACVRLAVEELFESLGVTLKQHPLDEKPFKGKYSYDPTKGKTNE